MSATNSTTHIESKAAKKKRAKSEVSPNASVVAAPTSTEPESKADCVANGTNGDSDCVILKDLQKSVHFLIA
jgi:hypothetical protein